MHTNNQNEKSGFKINRGLYFIDIDKYSSIRSSQLWEKPHKNKFFAWIFSFLFFAILIWVISILQISFWISDKSKIIELIDNGGNDDWRGGNYIWNTNLISSIVFVLFSSLIIFSLCNSIFKIIKNKSFKYISFFPTMFVFIQDRKSTRLNSSHAQ